MDETLVQKGIVVCSCCEGKGYKLASNLVLYEFCTKCKGKGRVDWVTNVVSNQSPYMDQESVNLNYRFRQRNVQELMHQIVTEYREVGKTVSIDIKEISLPAHPSHIQTCPSHMHTYPSHTHSMPISNTFKLGV